MDCQIMGIIKNILILLNEWMVRNGSNSQMRRRLILIFLFPVNFHTSWLHQMNTNIKNYLISLNSLKVFVWHSFTAAVARINVIVINFTIEVYKKFTIMTWAYSFLKTSFYWRKCWNQHYFQQIFTLSFRLLITRVGKPSNFKYLGNILSMLM